jgi:hypothetical protein
MNLETTSLHALPSPERGGGRLGCQQRARNLSYKAAQDELVSSWNHIKNKAEYCSSLRLLCEIGLLLNLQITQHLLLQLHSSFCHLLFPNSKHFPCPSVIRTRKHVTHNRPKTLEKDKQPRTSHLVSDYGLDERGSIPGRNKGCFFQLLALRRPNGHRGSLLKGAQRSRNVGT